MLGRVAYEISSGLTAGVNISYDEAFETRVSADLTVRFGGASTTAQRKEVQQLPVINALIATPSNRDVRVHDNITFNEDGCDGLLKLLSQNPVTTLALFAIKTVSKDRQCGTPIIDIDLSPP